MVQVLIRATGWMALTLAVLLLTLNVTGFFYLPERHSKTYGNTRIKAGVALREPNDVLAGLSSLESLKGEADVARLTELFSAGVMHYWPAPDDWDTEILTDFRENWVTAAIERIELIMLKNGLKAVPDYVRRERLDYDHIIAKGVGICSQVALAVTDFVQKRGAEAYTWGLDGHVVSVVGPLEDGRTYIVDSDYAVYLPLSVEEIVQQPSLIKPAYLAAGYNEKEADVLAKIYGQDGNFRYGTQLSWKVTVLQWGLPAVLIVISIVILCFVPSARKEET